MTKRKLLLGLTMVAAIAGITWMTNWADDSASVNAPQSYKMVSWEDLIPQGWDPLKHYRNADIGKLTDDNPKLVQMMSEMRVAWDEAPAVDAMQGQAIKLPGYIVPLEEGKTGMKSFLLVPYFGACIHSPPPPANQIIHVVANKTIKGFKSMDAVWVSGVLKVQRQNSTMGMSSYEMDAFVVETYISARD